MKRLLLTAVLAGLMTVSLASRGASAVPSIQVSDVTAEATSAAGASVTFHVAAYDDSGPIGATCTPPGATGTGDFDVTADFPVGDTTVTCTTASADFSASLTVHVVDTTAPSVTAPSNVTATTGNPGGTAVTFGAATASDLVDGSLSAPCSPASGSSFPVGTTTVTCTATDTHGNTGSASFTVTVTFSDQTAPTFTSVPTPISAEATSSAGAVVSYTITATDDSGIAPAIDCGGHGSGSTFPLGVTTVTCTATDGASNSSTASFTVTVKDTAAPTLHVPSDITLEADSGSGKVVTYTATASDAVSGAVTPSCAPASGQAFPIGTTAVNCSATDGAGNASHDSFKVTITDTTAPVFQSVPADRQVEANGPGGSSVNYTLPTATDAVDGPELVTCNPASGSTFPLGTTTVTCQATDGHGNSSPASFSILVADTTKPALVIPANRTVYADTPTGISQGSFLVAQFLSQAQALDTVDPHPVVSNDAPKFFTIGAHLVTFSATDASGNTASKSATLDVLHMPAPGTPPLPVPPAKTPPKDVTGLKAEAGDSRVRLSWQIPAGVDHVVVTRSLSTGGDAHVVYTGSAESFTDGGLVNGVEYRYLVVSVDKNGDASAGVATVALPTATLLRSPKDGARLNRAPKLVWVRNAEADYYNVQLFRGKVKILSAWPVKSTVTLKRTWKYARHKYKLTRGVYRWYVWPGFGARADVNYGPMLGFSTFQMMR
jgi:flavin reductase (DIM6/NTAB) family NADH-FMN oxidoreductase RutF